MSSSLLTLNISNTPTSTVDLRSSKVSTTNNEAPQPPLGTDAKSSIVIKNSATMEDSAGKQEQQAENAKTLFLTQKIAQLDTEQDTSSDIQSKDATQEFLDYMSKTPEERWYDALLAQEGHTEESLAALSPEDRMKVIEKIKEEIEKRFADKAGIDARATEPPNQHS